jgi:zinc transporter ZupT
MFISVFAVALAVLASLAGWLLSRSPLSKRSIQILIGLGAGMMTSISLTDVLPEAIEAGESAGIVFFVGFCVVFLLDYFQCTHPHEGHDDAHRHEHSKKSVWNFGGLYIHTFFDGVAIISAF